MVFGKTGRDVLVSDQNDPSHRVADTQSRIENWSEYLEFLVNHASAGGRLQPFAENSIPEFMGKTRFDRLIKRAAPVVQGDQVKDGGVLSAAVPEDMVFELLAELKARGTTLQDAQIDAPRDGDYDDLSCGNSEFGPRQPLFRLVERGRDFISKVEQDLGEGACTPVKTSESPKLRPATEDDYHAFLVRHLIAGGAVGGLKDDWAASELKSHGQNISDARRAALARMDCNQVGARWYFAEQDGFLPPLFGADATVNILVGQDTAFVSGCQCFLFRPGNHPETLISPMVPCEALPSILRQVFETGRRVTDSQLAELDEQDRQIFDQAVRAVLADLPRKDDGIQPV